MKGKACKVSIILFLVFLLTLFTRLYKIDSLPGEWFGDISNVHEYVSQIIRGEWPFYFFQSPGPLYHYLIVPIVLLYSNHGYETYKAASIIISLIGLIGTYLWVKEMEEKKLALITTLTMSISFWYLVWSRLGNSQIVIPVLISFMSLFIARFVKRMKFADLLFTAIFASLGLYTYPQTFILPIVLLIFIIFYIVLKKKLVSQIRSLMIIIIALILMTIPFLNIIKSDKGNFGPMGYVGEKVLPVFSLPIDRIIGKTLSNMKKVFLMLHVNGDKTFRVNVSNQPQIDFISGIFFLLGLLYFAKKKKRKWLFFIIFMLLVLPLPSISPVIPDIEIPSSARTIAIAPFVFLVVSAGFWWNYKFAIKIVNSNDKKTRYYIGVLFSVIFAYVVFTNLKLYFVYYTQGLPDRNFASGKIIAKYIDGLPKDVNVYFGSCCWGQWGHPEPKGVAYELRRPRNFIEYSHYLNSCKEVLKFPAIVIFGPKDLTKEDEYRTCFSKFRKNEVKEEDGGVVFTLIYIEENQSQIPKTRR